MKDGITTEAEVVVFRRNLRQLVKDRIREAIEAALDEELSDALGAPKSGRTVTRRGYRHGTEERLVTTEAGSRTLRVPRGRMHQDDGSTREFQSGILPRYARRTRTIDEAILGCYLAGANSRRIRKALEPLLGPAHLSKSAVSRVVVRLKELFARWNERPLTDADYPFLFLDGFHLKVRVVRRVVSVPVLAVLGVDEAGRKVLVALRLAASEASTLWSGVLLDLQRRGLRAPRLLIVDGHEGLRKALAAWPQAKIQRCAVHKLRNLLEHCPVHARPEVQRDFHRIIHAKDGLAARAAYDAFVKKWSALCAPVAASLEEAGLDLLTYYDFPKSMWKSLRTTNAIENLNREFRRRTKTQASFGSEDAALTLLYGLVAFGQIQLRKIDGHRELPSLLKTYQAHAA